jgi:hypothetical protein
MSKVNWHKIVASLNTAMSIYIKTANVLARWMTVNSSGITLHFHKTKRLLSKNVKILIREGVYLRGTKTRSKNSRGSYCIIHSFNYPKCARLEIGTSRKFQL